MGESLRDLGEFGLIGRLTERLPAGRGVLVGPGDDAAVLEAGPRPIVATVDVLVADIHFDPAISTPEDIGYKAIAVNVSDIAAMGARPRYAVVGLGAPADAAAETLEEIYDGFAAAGADLDVAVAGGDMVRCEHLVLSVTLIGETAETEPVRRNGARAGDLLCVTGDLGAAAAGLVLLRAQNEDHDARALLDRFGHLSLAHRRAQARVREGLALAAAGARAMIDISDGLVADVSHICEASGVGAEIEAVAVPVAAGVESAERWVRAHGRDEHPMFALRGGDDYELAVALPPEALEAARAACAPTPLTVVGRFLEEREVRIEGAGVPAAGWDHFRNAP